MDTAGVIEAHRSAGREFVAAGVRSFVREEGDGEPVLCLHGVPTSSYLYRKLLPELAGYGLRGVAIDLPGLGFAGRPDDCDYSWTGLGRFVASAVDALGIDRFHLVVHDIGGPIGFELAGVMPARVRSLTVLNTMIDVDSFRRPWMMAPFARRGLGEAWLAVMTHRPFVLMMRWIGVADPAVPAVELAAYVDLLKREDGGRAFLKIMRGFELTGEKRRRYEAVLRDAPFPVGVVWGDRDPLLRLSVHGRQVARAGGVETIHTVPAKHLLVEDQAPAVARHVATIAAAAT